MDDEQGGDATKAVHGNENMEIESVINDADESAEMLNSAIESEAHIADESGHEVADVENVADAQNVALDRESPRRSSSRSKSPSARTASSDASSHSVTITVTVAQAVPTDATVENVMTDENSKKKSTEAPRAQGYYHLEYCLMNEEEVVKTDVVSYGQAAKVFMERHDPRVIKTWQSGDLTWVAWSQSHSLPITNDVLLQLYKHTLEVKIWEGKDKCSTRAKFDRPKAFKLPQPKPGENLEDIGGVRALVLKQSRSFISMQPKKALAVRPLPSTLSHKKPTSPMPLRYTNRSPDSPAGGKGRVTSGTVSRDGDKGLSAGQRRQDVLAAVVTNDTRVKYTSRLAQLAEVQATTPRATPSTSKSSSRATKKKDKSGRPASKRKKGHADLANGICQVRVRLSTLFTGCKTATGRLPEPVPGVEDVFVSVTVNSPLMNEEQKELLNPMFITIKSVNQLPTQPLSHEQLRAMCKPVYCKYKFFEEDTYSTISKTQRDNIYWDDVNIALLGTLDRARLLEYIRGPGLVIEVHDRDRVPKDTLIVPTIFGDDLQDEKISNVGTVASRRTLHNAFKGREDAWDPYGVATVDLSELLLGSKFLSLMVPIHRCATPDVLGNEPGQDAKVLGVPGALDGPVTTPLPAGDYLDSGSVIKIDIELAYPLITPQEVLHKNIIPPATSCPFNRIIMKFVYGKARVLPAIQSLISSINAQALGMENLSVHVRDAALATYKLSKDQQNDRSLDIVTGFHLVDGQMQLLLLEGLRDQAIGYIWQTLNHPYDLDMHVLYNSDLQFTERLYIDLNIDLPCIKLHEPLTDIIQHPLLYIRDMLPKPCFTAIRQLSDMLNMRSMEDVMRNNLFPSSAAVRSLSTEFGVPLTAQDFQDMKAAAESESDGNKVTQSLQTCQNKPQTQSQTQSRWPLLEHFNPKYVESLMSRLENKSNHNYISNNKHAVQLQSLSNKSKNEINSTQMISADVDVAHNYSSQNLNSSNLAVVAMRNQLSKQSERRFTYNQLYSHSMTVVPANGTEHTGPAGRGTTRSPEWSYPGVNSAAMDNEHVCRPHISRIDELKQPWEENLLHRNILKPTLDNRNNLTWDERNVDMDVITKPVGVFGVNEPITIMLPGALNQAELAKHKLKEHEKWLSKMVVDDASFNVHRLLPCTEMKSKGAKASNQLDRSKGILKDAPSKHSLVKKGLVLNPIPSLCVVNYPDLEKESQVSEIPLDNEKCSGLQPGPNSDIGCNMDKNVIPVFDYHHDTFVKRCGSDFRYVGKNHYRSVDHSVNEIIQDKMASCSGIQAEMPVYKVTHKLPPISAHDA